MQEAFLKCIDPHCGLEYPIESINVECEKGHLLDVKYKEKPSPDLKDTLLEETLKEAYSMKVEYGDLENYSIFVKLQLMI